MTNLIGRKQVAILFILIVQAQHQVLLIKFKCGAGNNYGNLRMLHSGDTFSSDNTSGSNGSIVTLEVAG